MEAARNAVAVALVASLALAAPSCNGDDDGAKPPPSERRGVELRLDRDSPHPGEALTLTVMNRTPWRLEYGVAYRLERRVGKRWRWVNRDAAFILILRVLEPGGREREEIQLPGDLRPGNYRIVKSFSAPAVDRRFAAAVEFTVANL